MKLELQRVRIATGSDEDGLLVFDGDRLVAVLVRLSDLHDDAAGQWFLETGFGPLDGEHPSFVDLDHAQNWITARLSKGR